MNNGINEFIEIVFVEVNSLVKELVFYSIYSSGIYKLKKRTCIIAMI